MFRLRLAYDGNNVISKERGILMNNPSEKFVTLKNHLLFGLDTMLDADAYREQFNMTFVLTVFYLLPTDEQQEILLFLSQHPKGYRMLSGILYLTLNREHLTVSYRENETLRHLLDELDKPYAK